MAELRERGVDPRKVVAWVARSAGHDLAERVAPSELVRGFSLERVSRTPVRFTAADLGMLTH